jgi:hypothetical protein
MADTARARNVNSEQTPALSDFDFAPLCDLAAPVVIFPVRHHSPTAARLVRDLIARARPRSVLIEGPADFNDRMAELSLPHRPPLAVYSYVRRPDGLRRGAYYPLCEHSPEWQALRAGAAAGADVRFIDLPWAELASREDEPENRYADAGLARSAYVRNLCRHLGVENFHDLWDTLFEVDDRLTLEDYLVRCHHLCGHVRLLDGPGSATDRLREAFMAQSIRAVQAQASGPAVVVCGGYHALALHARLTGQGPDGLRDPADATLTPPAEGEERGIALTPYSFERLDALTGYNAGMPNPGFYHQVWLDREAGKTDTHRTVRNRIVVRLRERGQRVSAADLIAAETTARALADLRGHAAVWRTDLLEGLTAALIKDELSTTGSHPLLEAAHEVLRGGERGSLAEGTVLPPLVLDVRAVLAKHDLQPQGRERDVYLDLHQPDQRPRSRALHRLRLLEVPGFDKTGGSDLAARTDLAAVWESWRLAWSPDLDARCIEAARYGPTLAEAAAAVLTERAAGLERNAAGAALLLLQAALAGLTEMADDLRGRVRELVRTEPDFFGATEALGHLLYLYRYDTVLETSRSETVGDLLREAYARGLWLFEGVGAAPDRDADLVRGVAALRETFERCAGLLGLDREELLDVLRRSAASSSQSPLARGAALGAVWSLGATDVQAVQKQLGRFTDPDRLGDFLTGLFALAREQVQRQHSLVLAVHATLAGYSDEDFLSALPALRLAFTSFTPREKHHLALSLREGLGLAAEEPVAALEVDADTATRAFALEGKVLEALAKYGLRGAEA